MACASRQVGEHLGYQRLVELDVVKDGSHFRLFTFAKHCLHDFALIK